MHWAWTSIEIENINVTGAKFGAAAFTQIEGFHENGHLGSDREREGVGKNDKGSVRFIGIGLVKNVKIEVQRCEKGW